mmetsp:Transcript_14879/g.32137  ORF Transcript_14879/g.32137 Transcript_14879/m.32137 type:complete len:200 (+) Transcript_14879:309-908(+)
MRHSRPLLWLRCGCICAGVAALELPRSLGNYGLSASADVSAAGDAFPHHGVCLRGIFPRQRPWLSVSDAVSRAHGRIQHRHGVWLGRVLVRVAAALSLLAALLDSNAPFGGGHRRWLGRLGVASNRLVHSRVELHTSRCLQKGGKSCPGDARRLQLLPAPWLPRLVLVERFNSVGAWQSGLHTRLCSCGLQVFPRSDSR